MGALREQWYCQRRSGLVDLLWIREGRDGPWRHDHGGIVLRMDVIAF